MVKLPFASHSDIMRSIFCVGELGRLAAKRYICPASSSPLFVLAWATGTRQSSGFTQHLKSAHPGCCTSKWIRGWIHCAPISKHRSLAIAAQLTPDTEPGVSSVPSC